jgi:Trm5-related predicted tRNA methylase
MQIMYNNPQKFAESLPKMWQDVPAFITNVYDLSFWKELSEGNRRSVLEQLKGV